jgi:hypothetical protein
LPKILSAAAVSLRATRAIKFADKSKSNKLDPAAQGYQKMPHLFGQQYSRQELLKRVGHISQIGGVQLLSFDDGPARGVRTLEFRTGTGFNFKVAIERGLDIGYCEYQGRSLAWIPSTLLPGPWYHEQHTEFGWLRSTLGGFNNTCGLMHIGNPETAQVPHYNFPARSADRYGVHDRIGITPGQLLRYGEQWDGDECILEAEGRIVQAQAYGENLVLTRRYTARLGESRFFMHDEVENAGWLPSEHMVLYHMNIGFPIVDDGSELIAPVAQPPEIPQGLPASDPNVYQSFIAPQKDWLLQGFELEMLADSDNLVPLAIINPRLKLGVYVIYNQAQFPNYLEWRMMGEGQYAVGIEPCTNTFGRDKARELGQLITLQPGDKRTYNIEVGILEGDAAIQNFKARVDQLRKAINR